MTQGPGRFEYWLIKLDEQLLQACRTENPALFFFQNNGRTTLFMLEGLAKLYAGMYNAKAFLKLLDYFKVLEDLLGAVDYYDAFAKDFLADPVIPASVRIFTEEKRDRNLALFNAVLLKKKWINHDPLRTKKIRKELKKVNWESPEKEIVLLRKFYQTSVKTIKEFYAETGKEFTDLEVQVHSLRRKLRWLSIYPQALQGAIQLTDNNREDDKVNKYLTPEIVNSPYNKMPAQGNNKDILLLEKKYFLALSWMIAELSKLKDSGLRIIAIAEAIKNTESVTPEIAFHRAFELSKTNDDGLKTIMTKAKDLCSVYFEEKNLEQMIG